MSILSILPGIMDLVGKLIPDKEAQAAAKLRLLELQQAGEFRELDAAFDAIKAEATSADPWTSRARPSFLYVVYTVILAGIPMGGLYAFSPVVAGNVIVGFQMWLNAIPEQLWWLFGTVMLGYTGARSLEKVKGVSK